MAAVFFFFFGLVWFVYVQPVLRSTFRSPHDNVGTTSTVVLSPDIAGGVIFWLVKTKVFFFLDWVTLRNCASMWN